jgi:hypothetical protein
MVGFFKRNALRGAVKAVTTMTAGEVDTITTDNVTGEKELTGNQKLADALAHFVEVLS